MTTQTDTTKVDTTKGTRSDGFKNEIKGLKIKDPNAGKDLLYAKFGLFLMGAGIGLGVVGYFISHGTNSSLEQNDALTIAMIGIAVAISGGAIFLRFSLGTFFRFWLARLIFEQKQGRD